VKEDLDKCGSWDIFEVRLTETAEKIRSLRRGNFRICGLRSNSF